MKIAPNQEGPKSLFKQWRLQVVRTGDVLSETSSLEGPQTFVTVLSIPGLDMQCRPGSDCMDQGPDCLLCLHFREVLLL